MFSPTGPLSFKLVTSITLRYRHCVTVYLDSDTHVTYER
jgi:hypothetical protein